MNEQVISLDLMITIGDVINGILLVLTLIGLVFTGIQLLQAKKISRAELVKELYLMLNGDNDMREIFYLLEWSEFEEGEIDIQCSENESKVDKLLSFFEVVCSMYYRGVLTKNDMAIFNYELKRVFEHPDIQSYFNNLVSWQKSRGIGESYVNYKKYCQIPKRLRCGEFFKGYKLS